MMVSPVRGVIGVKPVADDMVLDQPRGMSRRHDAILQCDVVDGDGRKQIRKLLVSGAHGRSSAEGSETMLTGMPAR